eukprot:4267184-Lingulodinium_polyedra.AAC.1
MHWHQQECSGCAHAAHAGGAALTWGRGASVAKESPRFAAAAKSIVKEVPSGGATVLAAESGLRASGW